MAAKRKIAKPKPNYNRPWLELSKAQQNKLYTDALFAYTSGSGPNPGTSGAYFKSRSAA